MKKTVPANRNNIKTNIFAILLFNQADDFIFVMLWYHISHLILY